MICPRVDLLSKVVTLHCYPRLVLFGRACDIYSSEFSHSISLATRYPSVRATCVIMAPRLTFGAVLVIAVHRSPCESKRKRTADGRHPAAPAAPLTSCAAPSLRRAAMPRGSIERQHVYFGAICCLSRKTLNSSFVTLPSPSRSISLNIRSVIPCSSASCRSISPSPSTS